MKKISKDAVQNQQLNDMLEEQSQLKANGADVRDVRVNQTQVNANGEVVGINRPDLQYTLDGKRYYVEWDKPICGDPTRSLRGQSHGLRILLNDSDIDFSTQVILKIAGATCD
ncbi:hypothetical protein [Demequina sp. NBRC 110054]|uniref:hypothetical protein n=1 Tax=Demequina sp. NBRC 110054 TaxID=1570343 RepID=UPI000A021F54|nr:hypothetical protein [Demequina sp. NBRC 110054]